MAKRRKGKDRKREDESELRGEDGVSDVRAKDGCDEEGLRTKSGE